GRECRRDLPRQHQEREVPRNNLSDDADAAVTGKLRVEQLGPAGVVVEMPRDERDVDVSRLANRLPVVHALENGEETRVLPDAARKRVEPACSRVCRQALPRWKGRACRGYGSVDIGRGS